MNTKRILSIIGSMLLVLSPTTWAAGHGGGGGGFGGGGHFGGGFGGGGHFGGGGGRGGGHFGGGRGFRGGRAGFHSAFHSAGPRFTRGPRGMTNAAARQFRTSTRSGFNRRIAGQGFNRRIAGHIAERHDANWHRDWDRRHAHFFNHRFFVFIDGFWCGLDDGFFPWDYYPYYGYDYYPYDYYPGYYGDSNAPTADPTVDAAQGELAQLGYYKGPIDGIYGRLTRGAVAKYQIAQNLDVSGDLSAQTLQSLGLPQTNPS